MRFKLCAGIVFRGGAYLLGVWNAFDFGGVLMRWRKMCEWAKCNPTWVFAYLALISGILAAIFSKSRAIRSSLRGVAHGSNLQPKIRTHPVIAGF